MCFTHSEFAFYESEGEPFRDPATVSSPHSGKVRLTFILGGLTFHAVEQDFRTTFLVLEDDADDALLIRRAFTNAACRAFVCRNTSEARAYLMGAGMYGDRQRFPFPDIFLTDLRLGDESGLQFLEWIRASEPLQGLPVIVLSGSVSPDDAVAARNLGASRIIQKPGNAAILPEVIQKLSSEFCRPDLDHFQLPLPNRAMAQ